MARCCAHPLMVAALVGATVFLEVGRNAPAILSLVGPDRVPAPAGPELTAVWDGAGTVTGFTLSAGRVRDIRFTRP